MPGASSSSSLSDPPSSDEEPVLVEKAQPKLTLKLKQQKLSFGGRGHEPSESPEPTVADLCREPSPPHEYVFADNPDISVIVMFQNRFHEAFLKGVPNLGPQDIENGVVSSEPSEQVEDLLCGLLGLVLNRKKNPERGHYGRALEEALASQKHHWPRHWAGVNPVPSSKTFASLEPKRRIDLLLALVHWSLTSSEAVSAMIKESYKQARKDDDLNQPLSVQPWGMDSLKRRYFLIDGQVDTPFRIFRESDRRKGDPSWWSVSGSIEDAQRLARDLRAEKGQVAHRLASRITSAIPILEDREEKRKRREYRLARKAAFTRPDPGFSGYEGRTRGKRMKYNYDDDDIYGTDDTSTRRSARQSGGSTPGEGPRYTASGRQIRSVHGKSYGEPSRLRDGTSISSQDADSSGPVARSTRFGRGADRGRGTYDEGYESEGLNADGDSVSSGEEWDGDEEADEKFDDDDDDHSDVPSEDSLGIGREPRSLVVNLKCGKRLSEVTDKTANRTMESTDSDLMDIDGQASRESKAEPGMIASARPPTGTNRSPALKTTHSPTFEHRPAPTFSQYLYQNPTALPSPQLGLNPTQPSQSLQSPAQSNGILPHAHPSSLPSPKAPTSSGPPARDAAPLQPAASTGAIPHASPLDSTKVAPTAPSSVLHSDGPGPSIPQQIPNTNGVGPHPTGLHTVLEQPHDGSGVGRPAAQPASNDRVPSGSS